MPEFKERRLKKIRISPDLILELLRLNNKPHTVVTSAGFPEDALFVDCRTWAEYAYSRVAPAYIEILVYSKEFPIVPEGTIIPDLDITFHSGGEFHDDTQANM